jgi:hypothetical protein
MRKLLIVGGLIAAAIPSLALAQTPDGCVRQDNRAAGTVIGAVGGALLGNTIAGRGDKTTGTIIGGIGGAVVGHEIAGNSVRCPEGYYRREDGPRAGEPVQYAPVPVQRYDQAPYDNRQASTNLYARGYAYPTYGDQRYGDPRYDPRYAQGGYAYGRRANQWMPIAQRGQWLEQRIARGQQEGTVDGREARGLRQELSNLKYLEVRYRRQGLQPRMMADLDRRFDLLAARIQYERNDGDHPVVGYRR